MKESTRPPHIAAHIPHRGAAPAPGHFQRQTGSSWPEAGLAEIGVAECWHSPGSTGCEDADKDNHPGILQDKQAAEDGRYKPVGPEAIGKSLSAAVRFSDNSGEDTFLHPTPAKFGPVTIAEN